MVKRSLKNEVGLGLSDHGKNNKYRGLGTAMKEDQFPNIVPFGKQIFSVEIVGNRLVNS